MNRFFFFSSELILNRILIVTIVVISIRITFLNWNEFLSELGGYFNRNELYINIKGFGSLLLLLLLLLFIL